MNNLDFDSKIVLPHKNLSHELEILGCKVELWDPVIVEAKFPMISKKRLIFDEAGLFLSNLPGKTIDFFVGRCG